MAVNRQKLAQVSGATLVAVAVLLSLVAAVQLRPVLAMRQLLKRQAFRPLASACQSVGPGGFRLLRA
jgi:multidrug efflux pump subunit AcrB